MANTYPKSQVMLYGTDFQYGSNVIVENLASYLAVLDSDKKYTISDFQYIKHGLTLDIKIDYTQANSGSFPYNYASITNYTNANTAEQVYYYYITDVTQRSSHTLKLSLVMDTLNVSYSLEDSASTPNPYLPKNFNADTSIARQHENRFYNKTISGGEVTPGQGNQTIFRRIHKDSEGIIPPQYLSSDTKLTDTELDYNWYLVYRSADDISPTQINSAIDTFLCAEKPIPFGAVDGTGTSKTITASDLTGDTTYYCSPVNNVKWRWTIPSRTYWGNTGGSPTLGSKSINVYNDGTSSKFCFCWAMSNGTVHHETYYKPVGFKFHADTGDVVMSVYGTYLEDVVHTGSRTDTGSLTYDVWCIPAVETLRGSGTVVGDDLPSLSPGITQEFKFRLSSGFTMNNFYYSRTCLTSADTYNMTTCLNLTNLQYWDANNRAIGEDTTKETYGIDNIDRTDTKMMKIIKLPYCPIEFEKQIGENEEVTYRFDDVWQYDESMHMIKYTGRGLPKMEHPDAVTCHLDNVVTYTLPTTISKFDSKQIDAESKLYHSDITTAKITYDSNFVQIKPENYTNPQNYAATLVTLNFKPTSTINSGMIFKVKHPSNANTFLPQTDYEDYLMSSRNNEEGLYSYGYLDYQRYGKKYDEEANAIARKQAGWQLAIQGITAAAGVGTTIGSNIVTKHKLNKQSDLYLGKLRKENDLLNNYEWSDAQRSILTANRDRVLSQYDRISDKLASLPSTGGLFATQLVTSGMSLASSFANIMTLSDSQANAMAAKEANLSHQATTVAGSPDVDLMEYYSGNRLHYTTYRPDDVMQQAIYQVFDLGGYVCNKHGVPNYNNRIWHNYIQCTPVIDETSRPDCQLINAYVADIISKYQEGVTILHRQYDENEDECWDFKNEYENWESFIIE